LLGHGWGDGLSRTSCPIVLLFAVACIVGFCTMCEDNGPTSYSSKSLSLSLSLAPTATRVQILIYWRFRCDQEVRTSRDEQVGSKEPRVILLHHKIEHHHQRNIIATFRCNGESTFRRLFQCESLPAPLASLCSRAPLVISSPSTSTTRNFLKNNQSIQYD